MEYNAVSHSIPPKTSSRFHRRPILVLTSVIAGLLIIIGMMVYQSYYPRYLYRTFMFMELPDTAQAFHGEGQLGLLYPYFSAYARGRFSYRVEASYIDFLKQYRPTLQYSGVQNLLVMIHEVPCTMHDETTPSTDWIRTTVTTIPATGKVCLTGSFYPYDHYLIYDLQSGLVDHFVQGRGE